jgi:hypothetical protein
MIECENCFNCKSEQNWDDPIIREESKAKEKKRKNVNLYLARKGTTEGMTLDCKLVLAASVSSFLPFSERKSKCVANC